SPDGLSHPRPAIWLDRRHHRLQPVASTRGRSALLQIAISRSIVVLRRIGFAWLDTSLLPQVLRGFGRRILLPASRLLVFRRGGRLAAGILPPFLVLFAAARRPSIMCIPHATSRTPRYRNVRTAGEQTPGRARASGDSPGTPGTSPRSA